MCGPLTSIWRRSGLVLLACAMSHVTAAAVPDIQEVLQSMKDADKKYLTHSMSAEYNTEWESSTEPGKSRFLTRVTTRRDEASGRFEVLSADWRGATAAPEESIPTSRNHRLWTGEKAFDLGISDKTVMFVSKEAQGFVTDNAAYSGGEMLKGTVGSFRPAWDVMAKQADTRVLDSPEVVGGVPCLVLKGSGPYGEMTLWVDDATKAHGSQLKKSGSPPSISILISRLKARSNWMCRMAPKFGMRMCPG